MENQNETEIILDYKQNNAILSKVLEYTNFVKY